MMQRPRPGTKERRPPHKAIIADTMKLLGNSGYGKIITNVDRHRDVKYCTEKVASLMVNDKRFRQLDVVVADAYEIKMKKKTVTYAASRCRDDRSTPRKDHVITENGNRLPQRWN